MIPSPRPSLPAPPLVDVRWVAEHGSAPSVVLLDVRWFLGQPARGREEYVRGHLPGALFVDVDKDLASPPGAGPGRHPLPSLEALAETLARLGVEPDSQVIAYDDAGGATAARLWWLLRWVGHDAVRILDGGLKAWASAALPLEQESRQPVRAELRNLRCHAHWVVDKEQVAEAMMTGGLVFDARARERYEGSVEPVDARPGHIPGAVSAPFVENLTHAGGHFRDAAALRERYEALGAFEPRALIASCGSGVTACHTILDLHLAGQTQVQLYEGSWSDWSADPHRKAALGPTPAGEAEP